MKAEEIRVLPDTLDLNQPRAVAYILLEIAAQLAEANEDRRRFFFETQPQPAESRPPLGHASGCTYKPKPGIDFLGDFLGPHFCGYCGGYIGK